MLHLMRKEYVEDEPLDQPEPSNPRLEDYVMSNDNDPFDENINNFSLFTNCELVTFEEAYNNIHWINAMDEEIKVIEKNYTWVLTTLPVNKKLIGAKQVYKIKYKRNGEND